VNVFCQGADETGASAFKAATLEELYGKAHLFSFVDCKSFAVMERLGIVHAFAFDRHFDEYNGTIRVPR
jgi:predicted nucleic acid-binding protein